MSKLKKQLNMHISLKKDTILGCVSVKDKKSLYNKTSLLFDVLLHPFKNIAKLYTY